MAIKIVQEAADLETYKSGEIQTECLRWILIH